MEHLPIPRDPIRPHPKIPLASTNFADPGPFLTYKERHSHILHGSYPHVPTQIDVLSGRAGQNTAATSSEDVIDYYQGWLFFSLLAEFLGPIFEARRYLDIEMKGIDDEDEGLDEESDNKRIWLTTKHLHEDLALWRQQGPLALMEANDEYHQHLEACLTMAFDAFDDIEASFPGFTAVFGDQVLCIPTIAAVLHAAVATPVKQGPIPEMLMHVGFPSQATRSWLTKVESLLDFDQPTLKREMLKAGWCPGDISRVTDAFDRIAPYYYFRNFKPEPKRPDVHKDCPWYGCTLSAPAEPRHLSPDCTCPGMVTFEEKELEKIYEEGNIPCYTIGRLEDGGLGIALVSVSLDPEEQKKPENRYVALSHVWSEGMGNPKANALPFCQLSYAQYWAMLSQQMVDDQESREHDPYARGITVADKYKTETVNVWIDTMCCPSTPGYGKNLCLTKMRDIYSNAHAVLVRSMTLEDFNLAPILSKPEDGMLDLAAMVYLSPWMRRMWTLQEAALAGFRKHGFGHGRRLSIVFDGSLLSLESVISCLKQAPPMEAVFAFDFISRFASLTPLPYELGHLGKGIDGTNSFFTILINALKFRSVSVPSDELICLATLLGLRVGTPEAAVPLVGDGQTPEEGMCELWRRIEQQNEGVPSNIIFSSVPRLSVKGFRWAPRTFVQSAKYGPLFGTSSSTTELSKITEHGLRVRFSGVRLTMLGGSLYGNYLLRGHRLQNDSLADEETEEDQEDTVDEKDARARERILIVQMPTDEGDMRWYSIECRALDPETAERLDVHEMVQTKKMAVVLLETAPMRAGILVSIEDEDEELRVRTQFPVSIEALAPVVSRSLSSAHQCINKLDAVIAEAGDDEELREFLVREKLLSMAKEESLAEMLLAKLLLSDRTSASEEDAQESFLQDANLLARFGGVEGEMIRDQLWCID